MNIDSIMTYDTVTCTPETDVFQAYNLMKREGVRRLPVLDRDGNLVGVVSVKNITGAAWEEKLTLVDYAAKLASLKVGDVMTTEVVAISSGEPVEMAARIMADNDISILPVVDSEGRMLGIVTRSDLFRLLLELFGTRHYGIRVSFSVIDEPGTIARIAVALDGIGANIISMGNLYTDHGRARIIMKISGVDKESIRKVLSPLVGSTLDIREV